MQWNWQILKKDLINIFLCKCYRFRKLLTYPSFILPKNRYVHTIQVDELNAKQRLFIIRRSNNTFEGTFNVLGDMITLREDAIEPIDVPNMSLNLLGGKFKKEHLRFIPKMKTEAVQRWNGIKRIYLSELLDSYNTIDNICPIYFDVLNIHKITFPYQQNKSKELNKLLRELNEKPVEENDKYLFVGHTDVTHDPINLNYWHIEFKLIDFNEKEIPRKNSAWIEELSKQTYKNILSANAYYSPPEKIEAISRKYYSKPCFS